MELSNDTLTEQQFSVIEKALRFFASLRMTTRDFRNVILEGVQAT